MIAKRWWSSPLITSLVCISMLSAASAAKKKYTMEDLEALAKDEAWSELLQHVEDIPPAKRGATWRSLVEQTAVNTLKDAKADRDPFAALYLADQLTKRFRLLKRSKPFMTQRAEAGLKGFEACYRASYSGGPCNERILPFVEADPGNVTFALKAGQLVMLHQNHYFAIPFFRHAVIWSKGSKQTCQADRLAESLEAAMELPPDNKDLVRAAREVADTCWPYVRKDLLSQLARGNSYWVSNLCPVAKKKEKSRCK